MQKYSVLGVEADPYPPGDKFDNFDFYLASEVDARDAERLAEIARLKEALKELSDMYSHTWDKVDGGLMMMDKSVAKFERVHEKARKALGL